MSRVLASVRKISEVLEHPNAEALELAIIDGWQVCIAKGKHVAGEKVVYFEIDSVLPLKPAYEFLRKGCYIKKDWLPAGEGLRIKTIKLRKELSQGLVMGVTEVLDGFGYELGEDVTELLGVVKYDPPIPACLGGQAKGNFPSFIPKTDQNRIQNCYEKMIAKDHTWEITTKLEGSSMTIYHDLEGNWGVCSRNMDLKINEENKDNTFVKMFNKLSATTRLKNLKRGFAIQGELMGPGIQGNIEGFTEAKFFVFDVFDIKSQTYVTPTTRRNTVECIGLTHVPVIGKRCDISNFTLDDLLTMADGPSINAKWREGLVFKSNDCCATSFKVISNQYLLKEKS